MKGIPKRTCSSSQLVATPSGGALGDYPEVHVWSRSTWREILDSVLDAAMSSGGPDLAGTESPFVTGMVIEALHGWKASGLKQLDRNLRRAWKEIGMASSWNPLFPSAEGQGGAPSQEFEAFAAAGMEVQRRAWMILGDLIGSVSRLIPVAEKMAKVVPPVPFSSLWRN
jgi:hypothetical protein